MDLPPKFRWRNVPLWNCLTKILAQNGENSLSLICGRFHPVAVLNELPKYSISLGGENEKTVDLASLLVLASLMLTACGVLRP